MNRAGGLVTVRGVACGSHAADPRCYRRLSAFRYLPVVMLPADSRLDKPLWGIVACQEGSASRQCIPGSARAHLPEDTRGLEFENELEIELKTELELKLEREPELVLGIQD